MPRLGSNFTSSLRKLAVLATLVSPGFSDAQDLPEETSLTVELSELPDTLTTEQISELSEALQTRIDNLIVGDYIISTHLQNLAARELEIINALRNYNYPEAINLLENYRLLVINIYSEGTLTREQHDILMTSSSTLYMILRQYVLEVPELRAEFDAMGALNSTIQRIPVITSNTADQIQVGANQARETAVLNFTPDDSDTCSTIRLDLSSTRAALQYTLDQTKEDVSRAGQIVSLQNAQELLEDISFYTNALLTCEAAQPNEAITGIQLVRDTVEGFNRSLYSSDIAFIEDCLSGSISIEALSQEERLLYDNTAPILENGRDLANAYFHEQSISLDEFLSSDRNQLFYAITFILITDPENPLLRLLLL
jgi:hypothetical protein